MVKNVNQIFKKLLEKTVDIQIEFEYMIVERPP